MSLEVSTLPRRRVVVTGVGLLSPLGDSVAAFMRALESGESGLREMPGWAAVDHLRCHLGGTVDFDPHTHFKRRALRSMGRTAALGVRSSELALQDAGLEVSQVADGRTGIAFGSATGSPDALLEFIRTVVEDDASTIKATSYLRMMSHTAAVNIGVQLGICGRMYTTSSACTASSQAIGFAAEAIRSGAQDRMLAGGSDELTHAHCAVFDALLATSDRNHQPAAAVRPFDRDRCGLVVAEGACTLVLEALELAQGRGATILGEVIGFGTNTDGAHLTAPNTETQATCMRLALQDAALDPDAIGYVNAHGTATASGDLSESKATAAVLGAVPISSLKGHIGHTLGACGALEAAATLAMLTSGRYLSTLNLDAPDSELAPLDYLQGPPRAMDHRYAMTNNFAFGGINTSLVLARFEG